MGVGKPLIWGKTWRGKAGFAKIIDEQDESKQNKVWIGTNIKEWVLPIRRYIYIKDTGASWLPRTL